MPADRTTRTSAEASRDLLKTSAKRSAKRSSKRSAKQLESGDVAAPRCDVRAWRALREFESKLCLVARAVRLLPAITARNAVYERVRLEAQLEAGALPVPRFEYAPQRPCAASLRWLDLLRSEATHLPGAPLYLAKLDELELDVALLGSLGDSRLVRPLAARRFGTGEELIETSDSERGTETGDRENISLIDYSRRLLAGPALRRAERQSIPPDAADGGLSLRSIVESIARAAGLQVSVRVEPNLTAGAATGDRTVYVAARNFTPREAWRLALHEVLGHLTSAANGSVQPLRLLDWGTAFSFADQEGVALSVEAAFGLLDRGRLRSLAGRVVATRLMHSGAAFGESARYLFREYGFSAAESIAISERAYRGGGVARDAGYLLGYMRVRAAIRRGDTTLDELRMGRVGLDALGELRALADLGLVHAPLHRPNLLRSLLSTSSGTMPWRLPPSAAASLISVELT